MSKTRRITTRDQSNTFLFEWPIRFDCLDRPSAILKLDVSHSKWFPAMLTPNSRSEDRSKIVTLDIGDSDG